MSFSSGRNISNNVSTDEAQTLTNKTIDSANNSLVVDADTATVSNIEADNLKAGVIDDDLTTTSVNDDTVPSAKAAKAYTDAAASTASSNLTTHETSTTGVHGVTGDIVGTSDTQTLTNKTITGADIRTPDRLDVKQDTRANLEVYATTATDGQIVYATDEKKYFGTKDNALVSLGGGLGSPQTVSVISADDLQAASDFSAQNTDIVTGGVVTNGTLNGTLSLSDTASEMLTGIDKVIKYVAGAASQFDYFGHTHAIPQGFAGRTLAVELTYRTAAGYTNGDFSVEFLSDNGATVSYLANKIHLLDAKESADGNGTTARFLVNVPSDCQDLKVAFQNLSATSGITFFVDKISVDIDDFNYKNVSSTQSFRFSGAASTMTSSTAGTQLRWGTLAESGDTNLLSYNDSNGRFTALKDCVVDIVAIAILSGASNMFIFLNGADGYNGSGAVTLGHISGTLNLTAGDFFSIGSNANLNTTQQARLEVVATATSKHVVVDSGDAETEYYEINQQNNFWDASGSIDTWDFSLANPSFTGSNFIEVADVGGDTTITALQDVHLSGSVANYLNAAGAAVQVLNSSGSVIADQSGTTGDRATVPFSVKLTKGDFIFFRATNSNTNRQGALTLSVKKATLGEYHLVPVTDQENVFSARIANNGTSSIVSQSSPFIDSVTTTATGVVQINFKSGIFNEPPVVSAEIESGGGTGLDTQVQALTSSSVQIVTKQNEGVFNTGFNIVVQKQGADYKEPKAFIGNVVMQKTAVIKDIKADGVGGGTFTSGAWRTRDLNTLEDPLSIGVSLSSNQITLPEGTYEIDGIAPCHAVSLNQAKLYNVTDASDEVLGMSNFANNSNSASFASFIKGMFTITSTKTFEIRHICTSSKSTDGFGTPVTTTSAQEVYTQITLRKLK